MSTPTALLPHKHVRFSDSTLGLAGKIRAMLVEHSRSVDELQTLLEQARAQGWPGKSTLVDVVAALTVLFALGEVNLCDEGRIEAARK